MISGKKTVKAGSLLIPFLGKAANGVARIGARSRSICSYNAFHKFPTEIDKEPLYPNQCENESFLQGILSALMKYAKVRHREMAGK